jgi:hypothetical protein
VELFIFFFRCCKTRKNDSLKLAEVDKVFREKFIETELRGGKRTLQWLRISFYRSQTFFPLLITLHF